MIKELLDKYEKLPFNWGQHDCCLFSANVVLEATGIDYAKEFRGKYSTKEEAFDVIKKLYNCDDLEELVTKLTKQPIRQDWENVSPGDLVAYFFKDEIIMGINYGGRSYFITTTGKKFLKVPNRKCEGFWKVIK